jgi:hypothetical protein
MVQRALTSRIGSEPFQPVAAGLMCWKASLAAADVENLDHGAGIGLGVETGEAALSPFVANAVAGG